MLFVLVRVKNHFQYTLTMSGEQNMSEGEESLDYGSGNCSLWMTWSELIGVSRDTPGGYIVHYISYITRALLFAASPGIMFAVYTCGSGNSKKWYLYFCSKEVLLPKIPGLKKLLRLLQFLNFQDSNKI